MHHQNGFVRRFGAGDLVAQQVEHNTFNVGVLGSSPSGITLKATTEASCFGCLFLWRCDWLQAPSPTTKTNTGKAGLLLSRWYFIIGVARIMIFDFQRYPRECFALRALRKRGEFQLSPFLVTRYKQSPKSSVKSLVRHSYLYWSTKSVMSLKVGS